MLRMSSCYCMSSFVPACSKRAYSNHLSKSYSRHVMSHTLLAFGHTYYFSCPFLLLNGKHYRAFVINRGQILHNCLSRSQDYRQSGMLYRELIICTIFDQFQNFIVIRYKLVSNFQDKVNLSTGLILLDMVEAPLWWLNMARSTWPCFDVILPEVYFALKPQNYG